MKCICTWLALAGMASANPAGPAESAVGFLERVRSGNLNLEPGGDTALASSTDERKRQEISRRIKRLSSDLGNEPLIVGPLRQKDRLAAVLIHTSGGFDPTRLQVFPVAMILQDNTWLPAPIPASFENSGLGYGREQRQSAASLESWMLREQVILLENLRAQAGDLIRSKIKASITLDEISKLTPAQLGQRFLSACSGQRLPEILGLLGGLSKELPDQWPSILNAAETAIQSPPNASRPWRLLTAKEVIRVPVFQDDADDQSTLSIACLDPNGRPGESSKPVIEMIHLPIRKNQTGQWFADAPPEPEADGESDERLLAMFPAKFSLQHPSQPGQTAADARDALIAALRSGSPAQWTPIIRLQGDPDQQIKVCIQAARIWWELNNPKSLLLPIQLDFFQSETLAAIACQLFDPRRPDRSDIRLFILEKTDTGWLWNPDPAEDASNEVSEWAETRTDQWEQDWKTKLLADCPVVEKLAENSAPDTASATRLFEEWNACITRGDIVSAIRLTARLAQPDSPNQLLRNLGYEIESNRRYKAQPALQSILLGKRISAVRTRTQADGKPQFPLYTVVTTPDGPRILLEIELIESPNRGRSFLNRASLDRFRKQDKDAAEELAQLFKTHAEQTGER